MDPYVSFIKAHKPQQNEPLKRSNQFENNDFEDNFNEEEIMLQIKFLWTLAFNLTTKEKTSNISSSILEQIVCITRDKFSLPIPFWKRVCPHCLSFYHVSGYSVHGSNEAKDLPSKNIIDMDRIIAKDAPNCLSATLLDKGGPYLIFICGLCNNSTSWLLPTK